MKQAEKKHDLRARLVKAAREIIAERGLAGLKARDVAESAGSALGGLYTVFADLDGLVLAVNYESFMRLDDLMAAAGADVNEPEKRLFRLIEAYLGFAKAEPHLWRTMFEHRLPEGRDFPPEHYEALNELMQHIAIPLRRLQPSVDEAQRLIRARTMFSAFHGVIAMSLDHRFTGVTSEALEGELKALLAQLVRGLKGPAPKNGEGPGGGGFD
jgi:AcrR family transcriptional regulator